MHMYVWYKRVGSKSQPQPSENISSQSLISQYPYLQSHGDQLSRRISVSLNFSINIHSHHHNITSLPYLLISHYQPYLSNYLFLPLAFKEMASPQRFILPLCFIISLSTFSCYHSLHEDPPYHNLGMASGYDSRAYPFNYLSTIEDDEFVEDLIKLENEFSNLKRLSSSVQTISVDDYGAKGDGTDATEVYNTTFFLFICAIFTSIKVCR